MKASTAFSEGWGLYSERLGKDVGFYQDPYSDYGRLQGDIWRAIRLVVDTGVHSQHWTREQMVQYFHDHSSIDEPSVQAEVDRYIAWPGQALAYKIGQLKILELRDRAKKELGDKFDIRAFHDQVLDTGALPLDVLEARITAWIRNPRILRPLMPRQYLIADESHPRFCHVESPCIGRLDLFAPAVSSRPRIARTSLTPLFHSARVN